jgi:hypothetical protein
MPTPIRSGRLSVRVRRAFGPALALVCVVVIVGACSDPAPSAEATPDGLIALVADTDSTMLLGWEATAAKPIPIKLPKGDTTWVATGRADVLAAALANGQTATSEPLHVDTPLVWRSVKAVGPNGAAPKGPDSFVAWDAAGGRFATLAGDLLSGDDIRVVVIDPSAGTAVEIPIDRSVVAAPPIWIDGDRLVVVTGDGAAPTATIVDAKDGSLSDGPAGARLLAASADGHAVATMASPGAPVVVRATNGWIGGSDTQVASIAPPNGSSSAIAFALDATGQRLVIAWQAKDGSVTLAVHDARSDWKRVSKPAIGAAKGAVVAWMR